MKRILSVSAAAMICVVAVASEFGDDGYQFLNITPSSHVYAIGGQNISLVDDDITMVNQNPALLGQEMHLQLGLNYMRYLGQSNFMGLTFGVKAWERGAFAATIQHFGYGSMTTAGPDGVITGKISPRDLSFGIVYSHDITDMLRGGIAVKGISSAYGEYKAFAIATDLGINYYNPDNDLSLSFVIKSLGGQVKKFDNTADKLPWDIQLGYSQMLRSVPIRLNVTATNLRRWKMPYYARVDNNDTQSAYALKHNFGSDLLRHLVFGVEFVPSERFYVGIGYNYKTRTDMSTDKRSFFSGFSLGGGVNIKMIGVGVALAQPHSGGTTFMVNLRCDISQFLRQ